ncbi:MAG: hypothetical protein ACOX41_09310 [Anaerovoracaceae bacterium]
MSRFELVLYIITIVLAAIGAYLTYRAINYISQYYASYGMSSGGNWQDNFQYVLSQSGVWFVYAFFAYAGARIVARLDYIKPLAAAAPRMKKEKAPKAAAPAAKDASADSTAETATGTDSAAAGQTGEQAAATEAEQAPAAGQANGTAADSTAETENKPQ